MFEHLTKYQASFFLNAKDIIPSPDNITTLINIFSSKGFLPSTFQEIGPHTPAPQIRLRLSTPSNEWQINIASHRIDVEKNPTSPRGQNLGDIQAFANDATDIIRKILEKFPRKGNRLSIITSGFLKELNRDLLNDIYYKFFRPIPFYEQKNTFEWGNTSVSLETIDINQNQEATNVITMLSRKQGQIVEPTSIQSFDRIELFFDINTSASDENFRFSADSLQIFLDKALIIRNSIMDQVKRVIYG